MGQSEQTRNTRASPRARRSPDLPPLPLPPQIQPCSGFLGNLPQEAVICQECFLRLDQHCRNGNVNAERDLGHTHVCLGCGRSVSETRRRVRYHTVEASDPLIATILSWDIHNEGKSVIRPIAFKPLGGRLSAGGERYGSTPVLASRPPSHLTLYGSSSDVREGRWCGSPQPASLSALPPATPSAPLHQRHHSAIVTKSSSVLSGADKEPVPAPSPADSGVAELERDQHDYSTTERIRSHEVRVRAARGLMMQSFGRSRDERDAELARVRRDRALLRQRLEDTEWSLCQRAGEIALLKTQLKDAQNEQTAKGHEYLTLKADCRQLREVLDKKEKEIMRLRAETDEKEKSINRLQTEVDRLTNDLMESVSDLTKTKETSKNEIERLKTELKELRQELSDISLSGYEGIECGRTMRGIYDVCKTNEYHWNSSDSALEDAEVQRLNGELPDSCGEPCAATAIVDRLKCELEAKETQFNSERRKWSEEKDKVLRYQKQLQLNYVQMFKRSRTLEAEVDGLRLELELCNKNMKNLNKHGKTIEL